MQNGPHAVFLISEATDAKLIEGNTQTGQFEKRTIRTFIGAAINIEVKSIK